MQGATNDIKTLASGAETCEYGNVQLHDAMKEVLFILGFEMDELHYH